MQKDLTLPGCIRHYEKHACSEMCVEDEKAPTGWRFLHTHTIEIIQASNNRRGGVVSLVSLIVYYAGNLK